MIGLYRPGSSLLHRCPAWLSLSLLAGGTAALVVLRSPTTVLVGAVVCALGYVVAGAGLRGLAACLWSLRLLVVLLVPYQAWVGGRAAVVEVVGTLLVAVAAANLVTLTTRVSELLDVAVAMLAPLRRAGVDPERAGLVLALTVRALPVLAATARDVDAARRARGLGRSPRALLVPFVVRTVRHADRLGEALVARGVDD